MKGTGGCCWEFGGPGVVDVDVVGACDIAGGVCEIDWLVEVELDEDCCACRFGD